jgi:hypothetical protein
MDPRIARIVAPTVGNYAYREWQTDESARFKDKFGIDSLMGVMKAEVQQTDQQHCTQAGSQFAFSWVISFYGASSDEIYDSHNRLGSVFVSSDGLCAWTRGSAYWVGPIGLSLYLKRAFSFMAF